MIQVAYVSDHPDYQIWAPATTADPSLAPEQWPDTGYMFRNPAVEYPCSLREASRGFDGALLVVWLEGWRERALATVNARAKAASALRAAQTASRFVVADCGHQVARGNLMSASTGTACPDCYDSMS